MGVLVLGREAEQEHGLRPLDVLRDLSDIGKLIDIAFADDIAEDGSQFLQDLAMLTMLSPAMWALRRISADMRDAFDGFVWVENGRVVGNVTLTRDDALRSVWTASNVAVHPDFRRRGIARALMEATVDTVARRGGGLLSLQDKASNRPAYDFYRALGFVFVDGVVTMRPAVTLPTLQTPPPPPLAGRARPVRRDEWRALRALAQAARAPLADRIAPLRDADFMRSPWQRLVDGLGAILSEEQRLWLAVEDAGRFSAAAHVQVQALGAATIDLTVHPQCAVGAAEALVQAALEAAGGAARRPTVRIASTCSDVRAALRRLGLSEVRDLHRLLLEIDAL